MLSSLSFFGGHSSALDNHQPDIVCSSKTLDVSKKQKIPEGQPIGQIMVVSSAAVIKHMQFLVTCRFDCNSPVCLWEVCGVLSLGGHK